MGIIHGQEENTNEAYGNMSLRRCRLDKEDVIRGGRSLDKPDKIDNAYGFHSSSIFERHHHHYHLHPYRRIEKGYFLVEYMKAKIDAFIIKGKTYI